MAVKTTRKAPATGTRKTPSKVTAKAEAPAAAAEAATSAAAPITVESKVKRSEFVARVAANADLRPNQVRPVLEAVLAELGDMLIRGETLLHPSLGKLSVNRQKQVADADIVICKLRRPKAKPDSSAPDPMAAAAE